MPHMCLLDDSTVPAVSSSSYPSAWKNMLKFTIRTGMPTLDHTVTRYNPIPKYPANHRVSQVLHVFNRRL